MSDVLLHKAGRNTVTAVPNTFIDTLMRDANGEFVKVYLYLLRCLGDADREFSVAGVADALDHTQRDIMRALSYWERQGILCLEYRSDGQLSGICLMDSAAPAPADSAVAVTSRTVESVPSFALDGNDTVVAASQKPLEHSYSPDEMFLLGKDSNVQEILWVSERYIGHPLSSNESSTVLYWYDGMGMSADLVEYLVEYCVEHGHKSLHYMNKVAHSWVERGIETVDQARENDVMYSGLYRVVMDGFGIAGRNLTAPEREYLTGWFREYGFSEELISEACRRTILKIGRPSFQYADSILRNWHAQGAKSLDDIKGLDAVHKSTKAAAARSASSTQNAAARKDRFHNFSEHGYDYNAIQSLLVTQ